MSTSPLSELGQRLVEDFRSSLVIRSTAEYAKQEAKRSEDQTVQGLQNTLPFCATLTLAIIQEEKLW